MVWFFLCLTWFKRRWTRIGIQDYNEQGDSISLAKIGDKPFTIVSVEDSNYTQGSEVNEGVKITTKETWKREDGGDDVNKLHTTRIAVVKKMKNVDFRKDLAGGKVFKVICKEIPSKTGGKAYFDLFDAEPTQEKVV